MNDDGLYYYQEGKERNDKEEEERLFYEKMANQAKRELRVRST